MTGWLAVGLGAGVVEAWKWRRDPDNVLSRICGRHPWRTAVVAVAFLVHTNTHRLPIRRNR